jgi:hypothetical protein
MPQQRTDEAIQGERLSKDKNEDHADKELGLLCVGTVCGCVYRCVFKGVLLRGVCLPGWQQWQRVAVCCFQHTAAASRPRC